MTLIEDVKLTVMCCGVIFGGLIYKGSCYNTPHKEVIAVTAKAKTATKTQTVEQYIERFKNVAIAEQKKFGIPASIILAQGIIESQYGMSELATEHNNHFGIKCFEKGCDSGHCTNYADDKPNDRFKNYESAWMSYRDHSKFLCKKAYRHLKGLDYKRYAYGLKKAGYATKKSYANDLINIIENYNLNEFDK
jgi:flagellum-specific peptidoglycan hydrolase FlgJ